MKYFKRLMGLAMIFAIVSIPILVSGATDTGYLGHKQWTVQSDGDIVPDTDSSHDLGASGSEVDVIYVDQIVSTENSYIETINFTSTDTGDTTDDAYTVTLSPAPTAYADGMIVWFTPNTDNTGACSLNVNSLGVISIKTLNEGDPADSYIDAGHPAGVIYDDNAVTDYFLLITPDANP